MIHQLLVQLVEDVANIPGQLFFFYLQLKFILSKKAIIIDKIFTFDMM